MIITPLHLATKTLMNTLDADTEALNAYLTVQKMADTNAEEKRFKQITENRCLQRCLDISLDVAGQINALWEPLQQLTLLFNINTKADFLVGIKCLETAVYGACKRIEIFSSSLMEDSDHSDDCESQIKMIQNNYLDEANKLLEKARKEAEKMLTLAEARNS